METSALCGLSIARFEDNRFLTGTGRYVADIDREGQCHMAVVRSLHAHADISSIDLSKALALPGVIAVHLACDLEADRLGPLPCVTKFPAKTPLITPPRMALARDRVRHVGDPLAFVLAESAQAAVAAADLVAVEFDPLSAVTDDLEALADGAPLLWEQAPGNVAFRFEKGDRAEVDAAFAKADHIIELEIINQRIMAAPIEPRAGIASFNTESEVMELVATVQGVHAVRSQLANAVFKVPEDRIRVSAPDVGGGFGLKNFLYPEWVMLLWAARKHARPVKWVADRTEDHVAATHGRDIRTKGRLALDVDGRFLALEAKLVANMGAYLSTAGPNASTNASPTAMGGVYNIPAIYMQSTGVFTNRVPIDAYRGAGKPEANFIIERLIEAAARRFGFDPVELRHKNAIDHFPHTTAQGLSLDSGRFRRNIEDAIRHADRENFAARRLCSKTKGRLRGLGFGCFLETARGAPSEGAEIRFTPDGRIELRVGTESNGQGHETAYRQIAADRFGLAMETFDYIQADTELVRIGFGHGGARSMHMGGGALTLTIEKVFEKARRVAATLLQAEVSALSYDAGRFTVSDSGRTVSLLEVSTAARNPDITLDLEGNGLDTFIRQDDVPFTYPNGCHACEVEIDPETGEISILKYVIVDDYGALVNPSLTEGQVHGGVVQGIGQAWMEEAFYDPVNGQLMAGTFMDYAVPRAGDIPSFETHLDGVPTKANPLGVKGSGQAGCIGAPQTIVNAVLDALAPLGVEHIQMPLTPERIWRVIQEVSGR